MDRVKIKFAKCKEFVSRNPIAILATGPSLLSSYRKELKEKYKYVIGVNVAVDHFECDWWVFADPATLKRAMPKPVNKVLIAQKVLNDSSCLDEIKKYEYIVIENELSNFKQTLGKLFPIYSIEMALVLSSVLDSNDISFFGVDRVGATDCNGDRTGRRDASRWANEKNRWGIWLNWYRNQMGQVRFQYIRK